MKKLQYLKTFESFTYIFEYNSFSELSDSDIKDIAKNALEIGLIYVDDNFYNNDEYDGDGVLYVTDEFKSLLGEKYQDGFKDVPNILTIYRFVVLNDLKDLNTGKIGLSWFSNPNRINDPVFRQQMWSLNTKNLYLITAKIKESQIDIPASLCQRQMVFLENEIVLKDDSNINIISVDKIS